MSDSVCQSKSNAVKEKNMMHSHSQQSGHHGAKAIKQEAVCQTHEVVEERGDGENQREPLILFTTICKDQKQGTQYHQQGLREL